MPPASSPSKRRKINDGSATSGAQGMRSINSFFSRKPVPSNAESGQTNGCDVKTIEDTTQVLTDEELARKLHREWNGTDHSKQRAVGKNASIIPLDNSGTKEDSSHESKSSESNNNVKRQLGTSWNNRNFDRKPDPAHTKPEKIPPINSISMMPISNSTDDIIWALPLDHDPLKFIPDEYTSLQAVFPNGKATYALLTRGFVLITSTRSRIKIVDTLVNLLRVLIRHDPNSLLHAVWLATNSIGPPYENNELGIGGTILTKAIMKVSGITRQALKTLNNKFGDPGDVALEAKVKQRTLGMRKPTPLTISNVYETLVKISNTKGPGSQESKQRHVERMMVDAKGEEVRYLTRTLVQHLRIGAVKTTMLIALSRAFLMTKPQGADFKVYDCSELIEMGKESRQELFLGAEEVVKRCFARRPNYNDIVPVLLEGGIEALQSRCGLELHIPLKPMLGMITRDMSEMLVKLQGREFACEYKYDGQRAQIHCDEDGRVSIFSRHLEHMTDKYPDLVALIPQIRAKGVTSFIMEGEVVAVDPASGALRTFQTLAGRARKDVMIAAVSVDVCLFAFDLMFLNNEQLLTRSFRERRTLLRDLFIEVPNKFTWVKSIDATSNDYDTILEFFKSALDVKCEGIMVKVLDHQQKQRRSSDDENSMGSGALSEQSSTKLSGNGKDKADRVDEKADKTKGGAARKALLATYEPDKRLESWLKVKKDYDSAADSLDLVPIAGWHGSGRKAKWWSPILLAVRNPETGTFEAVCKCISGFSDAFYTSNRARYDKDTGYNCSVAKPAFYDVAEGTTPDVWFEPQEVWEVKFGDITISPTYLAAMGLVDEEKGLSLRFPRFIRVRDDKSIEEASTREFLAALWEKQVKVVGDNNTKQALSIDEADLEEEEVKVANVKIDLGG